MTQEHGNDDVINTRFAKVMTSQTGNDVIYIDEMTFQTLVLLRK
jgi:hypothetical protein